jgi:hypothetical protein
MTLVLIPGHRYAAVACEALMARGAVKRSGLRASQTSPAPCDRRQGVKQNRRLATRYENDKLPRHMVDRSDALMAIAYKHTLAPYR